MGVSLLAAGACSAPAATPAPEGSDLPAVALSATATEFAYSPRELAAPAGQRVRLTLKNDGVQPHNFVIEDVALRSAEVSGKKSLVVQFVAPQQPGRFPFYCSVPGHCASGMEGTLVVQEAGPPP